MLIRYFGRSYKVNGIFSKSLNFFFKKQLSNSNIGFGAYNTMDVTASQCTAQSVGPANQLFGLLIQTILAAQCSISPPDLWPEDYGQTFLEKGSLADNLNCSFSIRFQ